MATTTKKQSVSAEKLEELRGKLQYGELAKIARLADVHYQTARRTLLGERDNLDVIRAAIKIVTEREAVMEQLEEL